MLLSPAAVAEPVPEGGRLLVALPVQEHWRFHRWDRAAASMSKEAGPDIPGGRCVRITSTKRPKNSWDIQLKTNLTGPIATGDTCLLTFWMRRLRSADESGDGVASAVVQQSFAPHRKVLTRRVAVAGEWQQFFIPFKATFGLVPGKANLGFHLGFHPQELAVAEFQLVNYGLDLRVADLPGGKVTYVGRDLDASWRRAAANRIAEHRMGDLTVAVVDITGNPVPDATVDVNMTRHAFGFGAALVSGRLVEDSPGADRYREIVAKYYNKVVLENDLKWGPWEVSKSNKHRLFRREWTDEALAWLGRRNIDVRGHWLSWGSVSSGGQDDYVGKPEEHRRDLFAHIREKVAAVGTRVCEWDVINHPVGWGVTYEQMHEGLDFHADIFQLCREAVPKGVGLWINEGQVLPGGGRRVDYERIIRYLIAQGQAPAGIGFMGHFGSASLTPIPELFEVMERYAAIIPRLQLTEFDVNVGDDEELQADYLRDVMTIAFSHPSMCAIVMWGFWAGRHWKPEAALYRKDWSVKPAGEAWLELVGNEWWTSESGTTDRRGRYRLRGFLGDYTVKARAGGRKGEGQLALEKEGARLTVVVR